MRQVTTGLGSLFNDAGDDDDGNDPLVYVKPKDPSTQTAKPAVKVRVWEGHCASVQRDVQCGQAQARPAAAPSTAPPAKAASPAPAPASSQPAQEFIFAISVPGLFFLNPATQAYDSKSASMVGCVIVGAGASYNLMFYDSNKATLCVTPVSPSVSSSREPTVQRRSARSPPPLLPALPPRAPQLTFGLQAGGRGSYVSLVTEDGAGWSVACASAAQATELLRHLAVTAAHVGVHRGSGGAAEVSCIVEEAATAAEAGAEAAPAAADGDTVSLAFTAYSLTTVPSAKPTDVFKAPPVCSNAQQAARSIDEGARTVVASSSPGAGLARAARNLRVGDRRLILLPLAELMSAGDADAANLAPGAALTLSRGANVIVEVTALRLKAAPAPPATPPAAEAPAPAAASVTTSLAAPPPAFDGDADGRARSESSLRERMARLAMAGRPGGSAMPVMSNGTGAGGSGGMEVRAVDAASAGARAAAAAASEESSSTAIQRYRGESEVDDAVNGYLSSVQAQAAPAPAPSPAAAPAPAARVPTAAAPEPAPATPAPAPAPAAAAEPAAAAATPQQQFLLQQQAAAAAMMGGAGMMGMMHPMMMHAASPYGYMSPPPHHYAPPPAALPVDAAAIKALSATSEAVQVRGRRVSLLA